MNTPLVTIITPSFNRGAYLAETIESVLDQQYPRFEYIVLDDGSTDNTLDVLARYSQHLRLKAHPNMGEASTVNRGFALAQGDLISVVNSDDPVLPGFLEQMVDFMSARPELLAAYPDWYRIDSRSRHIGGTYRREFDLARMLTDGICLIGPGAVIRRSALELVPGRDVDYRFIGDYAFWLALGLKGPMARAPFTLATHRVHDDSATIKYRGVEMAQERALLVERFYAQPHLPPLVHKIRPRALSTAYFLAGTQALYESPSAGRTYLLRSFQAAPAEFIRHPKRLVFLLSLAVPGQLYRRFRGIRERAVLFVMSHRRRP